MNVDLKKLKKFKTRLEAQKEFKKLKKIYYYFNPFYVEDTDHKIHLFNIDLDFNSNFKIVQDMYKGLRGSWQLSTDNVKYEIEVKNSNQLQLTFFN